MDDKNRVDDLTSCSVQGTLQPSLDDGWRVNGCSRPSTRYVGYVTPFVDAGAGNTIADTKSFHRAFTSFGYNAQFEVGTEIDAGPFGLTASLYERCPLGTANGGH